MLIALLLVIVLLLLVAVTLLMRGRQSFSPMEFYARGKEIGFTVNESNVIHRISTLAGISDPTNVYWSIRELDACIAAFSRKYKNEGTERDRENLKFMDKLYEFRKRLEFEQPKYRAEIGRAHV